MRSSQSVGGVAIAVPLIVCMAGVMAAQSVEVSRGYTPRPNGSEDVSATVGDDAIQLFKSESFNGDMSPVDQLTTKPAGALQDLPKDLEDSLSSLRWNLPPGVVVVFFEDDGGKGEQYVVWGKGQASGLSKWNFNDKASQFAWYYVGGNSDLPPHIKGDHINSPSGVESASGAVAEDSMHLFKSKNFKANDAIVSNVTGQPAGQLNELPQDLPDSLTSLQWNLPPGVVVVFFQDANGMKQQAAIWGQGQVADIDVWDFNDKISRWAWYFVGSGPKAAASAN
jgi:hypothetical protein